MATQAKRGLVLLMLAGAALAFGTTAFGVAQDTSNVVASGQWDGHAWRLQAVEQDGRHCYRISVDFPFTRFAPPHLPNCAFSSHGGWNTFTACPLAFAYGIADSRAASVRVEHPAGTARVKIVIRQGVKYFATQIPCGARAPVDQLDAAGHVLTSR